MPYTDAQKRARNNYESAHYTVIGCKVRKEYAARFRAACAAMNTTPAAVFKAAADALLLQYENNTRNDSGSASDHNATTED